MRDATEAELTGRGVVHTYQIHYPAGHHFSLRGIFGRLCQPLGVLGNTIRDEEGRVWLLDPRAVVSRDGLIIHEPRRETPHDQWVADWLRVHPEWPRIVTESLR
jgi:hypothetical protein